MFIVHDYLKGRYLLITEKAWRKVLVKAGFRVTEGKRHVKGIKPEPQNGTVKRVQICRKGDKQFNKGYHCMLLKQAGLTQQEFDELLRR